VVGDLAGLCAALYQRGVAVVQIPTTLVAQVDSAYGGKVGVDLPEAKNYVGAFHQPSAVFADPGLLATLPVEELRAGFSEVIKTALIAGGALWETVVELPAIETLVSDQEALRELVESCLKVKLEIVAADERDQGRRASLNLGHTFAHALEAATGYAAFRHGEAVGVGLLAALRMSEHELDLDRSVRDQVQALLRRNELPISIGGVSVETLIERAALDKKRRAGRQNFVLLRSPGEVMIGCEVSDRLVRDALTEIVDNGGEG
jgi:shikimate kinase/3-dehydroquinate synthase